MTKISKTKLARIRRHFALKTLEISVKIGVSNFIDFDRYLRTPKDKE